MDLGKECKRVRIGMEIAAGEAAGGLRTPRGVNRRFADRSYSQFMENSNTAWVTNGSRLQQLEKSGGEEQDGEGSTEGQEGMSDAEKIYQAAAAGKENPIKQLRQEPKVPYGYLAKDGVIIYNGVCFVCDEETNSICLGDMTEEDNVLNITLSGGGHLKVNRRNLGDLSRAVGMFSPEDLNLIMRAIAQDTKIQSVKKEIEDTEASVGNSLRGGKASEDGSREEVQDE